MKLQAHHEPAAWTGGTDLAAGEARRLLSPAHLEAAIHADATTPHLAEAWRRRRQGAPQE